MVLIKCSNRGFLIGFDDGGNPLFGGEPIALLLDVNAAVDLCLALDDPQNPSLSTVSASD